jgi:hypothetical protein
MMQFRARIESKRVLHIQNGLNLVLEFNRLYPFFTSNYMLSALRKKSLEADAAIALLLSMAMA